MAGKLLNYNDLHKDRIAERDSVWTVRLPRAFVCSFLCGSDKGDAQCSFCACMSGVEDLFLCRAEWVTSEPFESIVGIPIAGSIIVDQPLLVYRPADRNGCPIGDGDIFDEFEVVGAWSRCGGGCDRWGGDGCIDRGDGRGGGQDLRWRKLCRRAERRGRSLGRTG